MKLALRWVAALIALAVIAWIWLARDTSTNSSAAAPHEVANELDQPNTDELAPVAGIEDASDSPAERVEASISESNVTASTDELAIVHVRVISKDTGAPVARYDARAEPNPLPRGGWSVRQASSTIAQPGEFIATNDDGRAALAVVPHRAHIVTVNGWGKPSDLRQVEVPALEPGATFEVELQFPTEPDLIFFGLVVDADTHAPIVGAVVHFANDSWKGDADTHARSDSNGVFELDARSWLDTKVRVTAEGYGPAIVALTADHATRSAAFEIGLSRVGTLEVLVLDNGVPFADAEVEARTEGYDLLLAGDHASSYSVGRGIQLWRARSGLDGVAHFRGMSSRVPFDLAVRTTSKSRAEVTFLQLAPGETRRIEIVVNALSTISGRVETAQGKPISAITLWLVPAASDNVVLLQNDDHPLEAVKSDAKGRFQFRDVLKGRWHVGLAPATVRDGRQDLKGGHALTPLAEVVELDGINTSVEIVVRALEGRFIRGTTLDADGKPVACNILASHASQPLEATAASDADGRFEIGPLPDGMFLLVACGDGDRGAESKPLSASAGTSDVELRLMPACAVTFRIAPRGGEQLDAKLWISSVGQVLGWVLAETENGVCTLTGLREGPMTVRAETSSGLCAVRSGIGLRAGPPPTEVELHLEPGAWVSLRYEGPLDAENYEVLFDGARISFGRYSLGTEDWVIVPAGSIEVRKVPRDGRPPEVHQLTLAPGEERELVIGK